MKECFRLAQPSSGLSSGPDLAQLPKRVLRISYADEGADGAPVEHRIVFSGTEAFRVTYYEARGEAMLAAYDRLVDCGRTVWLSEVEQILVQRSASRAGQLVHYMINFDDGPCYEVLATGYRLE